MLKKINAGKIESDEGFSIAITRPEELKYIEGEKYLFLGWTLNSKNKVISIYLSDAGTWSSLDRKVITISEKEKIKNNISRAIKLLDGDFTIV